MIKWMIIAVLYKQFINDEWDKQSDTRFTKKVIEKLIGQEELKHEKEVNKEYHIARDGIDI